MRLQANVTLLFRNIVLVRYRSGSAFRAPGLDLLAPLPPGEQAWLHLQNGYLLSPFCFPEALIKLAVSTTVRPSALEGVNVVQVPAPLPASPQNCTNDTAGAVLERCYPLAGTYIDVAMYGSDVRSNGANEKIEQSGYLIHFLDFTFLCPSVLSMECIAKLGPVGCVYFTLSSSSPPSRSSTLPPQLEASTSAGASGGGDPNDDDGRGARRRLAIILGSVLGGTVFLAALLATLLLVRHRAQRALKERERADDESGRTLSVCKASDEELGRPCLASAAERCSGAGFGTPGLPPSASMYDAYDRSDKSGADDNWETPAFVSYPLHALAAVPPVGVALCPLTEDSASTTLAFTADGIHSILTTGATTGTYVPLAAKTLAAGAVITTATPPRADFRFGVQLLAPGGGSGGASTSTAPLSADSFACKPPAGRVGDPYDRVYDEAVDGDARQQLAGGHVEDVGACLREAAQAGGNVGGGGSGCVGAGAPDNVVTLTRRVLGKGATGRVYEGAYMGKAVAVKVVYAGSGDAAAAAAAAAPPPQRSQEPSAARCQTLPSAQLPDEAPIGAGLQQDVVLEGRKSAEPNLAQPQGEQRHGRQEQQHGRQQYDGRDTPAVGTTLRLGSFSRWSAGAMSATLSATLARVREFWTSGMAAISVGPATSAPRVGVSTSSLPRDRRRRLQQDAAGGCVTGSSSGGGGGDRLLRGVSVPCSLTGVARQQALPAAAPASPGKALLPLAPPPPPPQQQPQQQEQPGQQSGGDGVSLSFLDSHDPRFEALFRQEAEVLGRCTHPNVVRLLAACVTPPRLCLVMELMDTSLEAHIYSGRTALIPLAMVLHIAAEVCQGLEYLHPTIIHRDLKPANVLLNGADSPNPIVKLSDFGLARIRSATMPTQHPGAGTPAYLAPECYDLDNSVVTHHADMFALGVLLWAMLTGQQPWKDHSVVAVGYKVSVLKERLPLDQLSSRRCPPQLKRLVRGCWEEDPRRRPAAAEAAKELRAMRQKVLHGGAHHHRHPNGSSGPTGQLGLSQPQSKPYSDAAGAQGPQRVLSFCAPTAAAAAAAAAAACDGSNGLSTVAIELVAEAAAEKTAAVAWSPGLPTGQGPQRQPMGPRALSGAVLPSLASAVAVSTTAWQVVTQPRADRPDSELETESRSLSEGTLNRLMDGVTLELEAD